MLRIDDVNQDVGRLEVVLPIGADRFLASDIPHVQLDAVFQTKTKIIYEIVSQNTILDAFQSRFGAFCQNSGT